MSSISHQQLLAALAAEGVKVVQVRATDPETGRVEDWTEHNRAGHGPWGDMNGQLNHHTGPFSSVAGMVSLIWRGRAGLPGPLATGTVAPDGTVYLTGWGRSNHAGSGSAVVHQHVVNEDYDAATELTPGADSVDGNSHYYGWEVMHPGDGSPYPDTQIQALVKINAAVCRAHGWNEHSCIHHKEWTRRKIDMSWHGSHAGGDLRMLVRKCLSLPPGQWTLHPQVPTSTGRGSSAPIPATPTPSPKRYFMKTLVFAAAGTDDSTWAAGYVAALGARSPEVGFTTSAEAAQDAAAAGCRVVAVGGPAAVALGWSWAQNAAQDATVRGTLVACNGQRFQDSARQLVATL